MMDHQERELFEQAVRRALENLAGPSIDAALDELGWRDALESDPQAAISVVFEGQGETNTTSSAFDDVLAYGLGGQSPDAGTVPCIVLPPAGRWTPPGLLRGDRLLVEGLGTGRLQTAERAVVAAEESDGTAAVAAVVKSTDLAMRTISGLDPRLGLVDVTSPGCAPAATVALGPGAWSNAVRLARLATAHELVGAARAMVELARTHALERVQFGRPIGAFQAVRHRLVDSRVAIEATGAALSAAWRDGSPETAALARGQAGLAARTVARHAQQVLAGIGFTTEHPFHRYLRRVLVLDQLFGSARDLTRSLGQELIDSRRLPPLPPL
ncbi:MAG TPA: acyl-CoA dehydrogenase family protein [Acidimicrobiales bacterium]|nr:acyl-CoA dehydrogenase family protein [Acidimicrobiales bacterium]